VAGWAPRQAAGLAVGLADGAVAAGATLALKLAFAGAGDAGPGASQAEADAGLGNDLDQPRCAATQMLSQPAVQVLGPVLDLPRVRWGMEAVLSCAVAAQVACSMGSSASAGFLTSD
jgi:hypothetical protein